jgi:hypothetical protein
MTNQLCFFLVDDQSSLFKVKAERHRATHPQARVEEGTGQYRSPMRFSLLARLTAEFVGTAFLLMAVVGSGIMGERLVWGKCCDRLTREYDYHWSGLGGADSYVRTRFGSPLQPCCLAGRSIAEGHALARLPAYIIAQVLGCYVGDVSAHAMFALPLFSAARRRSYRSSRILSTASNSTHNAIETLSAYTFHDKRNQSPHFALERFYISRYLGRANLFGIITFTNHAARLWFG